MFSIGLIVCCFSLICTIAITAIHNCVFEQTQNQTNEKEVSDEDNKFSMTPGIKLMLLNLVFVCTSLHAFYPNFSKFLQQNYGFTNVEAGHLSSIPFMLSSVLIPLFGSCLMQINERHYSLFFIIGMISIGLAHFTFIGLLNDVD